MERLREEFDSDRITSDQATEYRTETNCYEVACSVCNRSLFIDAATKADIERAIELGVASDFTCAACDQEYDALAHGQS
jgi:hypothetical protein